MLIRASQRAHTHIRTGINRIQIHFEARTYCSNGPKFLCSFFIFDRPCVEFGEFLSKYLYMVRVYISLFLSLSLFRFHTYVCMAWKVNDFQEPFNVEANVILMIYPIPREIFYAPKLFNKDEI